MKSTLLTLAFLFVFPMEVAAQCTKDIDCKGTRLCNAGMCVAEQTPTHLPLPATTAPALDERALAVYDAEHKGFGLGLVPIPGVLSMHADQWGHVAWLYGGMLGAALVALGIGSTAIEGEEMCYTEVYASSPTCYESRNERDEFIQVSFVLTYATALVIGEFVGFQDINEFNAGLRAKLGLPADQNVLVQSR